MKKSIAKKWVAALRSGEYVQGQQCLVSPTDKFCCLGVLCNLSVGAGVGEWGEDDAGDWYFETPTEKFHGVLPQEVLEWAGMKTFDGRFNGTSLININDTGKSFSEIADIIEANWEAL